MTKNTLLHPSLLPLTGGINFRDQGGYLGADGRKVKKGLLLRSGSLDRLTSDDCHFLDSLPLTHILDYRDPDEIQSKPDVIWGSVNYESAPANPLSNEVNANLDKLSDDVIAKFDPVAFMQKLYMRLPFDNSAYRRLIQIIQQPQTGALVQHCAVGKDRTGIGSAIVLLTLGVDKQSVIEDYMITETTLAPYRSEMLSELSDKVNEKGIESFSYVLSVQESFIGTALNEIEKRYGSTNSWLEQEFGLTADQRTEIQRRYLED